MLRRSVHTAIIALLLFFCAAVLSGNSCKRETTATGEPSRNAYRADYYDVVTAGPGYPGRSEIRVYLVKEPVRSPPPSTLIFPSRWEVCRDAVEMYRPILAECGKTIVYVDSPVGADCVIPEWEGMPPGRAAYTDAAGKVAFGSHTYGLSDDELRKNAAHEFLHVLGVSKHSTDENDIGHPKSRASRLSARDLNTVRRVLKP